MAAARLRAAIWQSIFTHDMRRYLRSLYRYMGDITTLITGPSGTGKELVAQSIAYSRFVEFDSKKRRFATNYADSLVGLNLTAIAPTLIESELFGHAKGAFTDAKTERQGYLDESKCPRWGTVFLDEIGELDAQIQVKLLESLAEPRVSTSRRSEDAQVCRQDHCGYESGSRGGDGSRQISRRLLLPAYVRTASKRLRFELSCRSPPRTSRISCGLLPRDYFPNFPRKQAGSRTKSSPGCTNTSALIIPGPETSANSNNA